MVGSFISILRNYISLFFTALGGMSKRKGGGFLNSTALNAKYLLHLYFKKDYIFIHINKTGGSSIEKALGDIDQVHLSAYTIKNYIGSEEYNKRFKFAFVRNPYDRLVSQYHYRYQQNQTDLKEKGLSFKEWVMATYVDRKEEFYNYPAMFQNQLDWLTDRDGNLLVDFVGRFENMQGDFDAVCDKLGISRRELPHKRKSTRKKNYTEYYDEELKQLVQSIFEKDFSFFKYEK